jgi:membrane protein DedA with SNARE-associated domain
VFSFLFSNLLTPRAPAKKLGPRIYTSHKDENSGILNAVESILNTLLGHSGPTPYLLVFSLLIACGFGFPMPEDVILFASGMLAYYEAVEVWVIILVCFTGVMLGDCSVFTIGSLYGRRLRKTAFVKRILPPRRMRIVRRKLHDQGSKVIFAARFMPGLRTPVFFTAGTLHLPFRVFIFFDGLAALISVPTIIYAVYFFGDQVDHVIRVIKRIQFGVIGTIVMITGVVVLKTMWSNKKEEELAAEESQK